MVGKQTFFNTKFNSLTAKRKWLGEHTHTGTLKKTVRWIIEEPISYYILQTKNKKKTNESKNGLFF